MGGITRIRARSRLTAKLTGAARWLITIRPVNAASGLSARLGDDETWNEHVCQQRGLPEGAD